MKQIDRIEQLEEQLIDSDTQIRQLRGDMAAMDKKVRELSRQLGVRLKEELSSKKERQLQEDIAFAQAVKKALKENQDAPFVTDRAVFSTKHLHQVIQDFVSPELHQFECINIFRVSKYHEMYTKLNVELRTMCKRLVNSGLFMTRKAQQYVPVNPHDITSKPSTTRGTVIIAGDFKKYQDLSVSALGGVAKKQQEKAIYLRTRKLRQEKAETAAKLVEEIEEIKARKAKLDSQVSFL